MFILSNADGIVYKNDNAFIIRFAGDNAAGGTPVFFGMLGVTFFGLLLTPVFYLLIRGLVLRGKMTPLETS